MEFPDLDRTWETFVHIGPLSQWRGGISAEALRRSVSPAIAHLTSIGLIGWYSFLAHDRASGVPTVEADTHGYWHVRLSLKPGVEGADLVAALPSCFRWTRPIPRKDMDAIDNYSRHLMITPDAREEWRQLGEQSENVLWWLGRYRPEAHPIAIQRDLIQRAHYYCNMCGHS